MQSSTVIEIESHRRVVELVARKMSVVDEQRAGESRLNDESIASVEVENNELGASPAADYRSILYTFRQRARIHFTQNVALSNRDLRDLPSANRAVEIARDRLGLR
jgi:hypothetical protein